MKLFPLVASLFAQSITGDIIANDSNQLEKDFKEENFSNLDVLHHFCAGMKAVYSQETIDALFLIRQCLGGAGYSAWSGIPLLIEDWSPFVTFEGDNTVMAQQCSNFLFKELKKAKSGSKRSDVFEYLS